MVENFSIRRFTKPQDRLRALAGLVEIIRRKTADKCIFGHWWSQFPTGLLWTAPIHDDNALDANRSIEELAPSWSWASIPPPRPVQMPECHSLSVPIVEITQHGSDPTVLSITGFVKPLEGFIEVDWSQLSKNDLDEDLANGNPCVAQTRGQMIIWRDRQTPISISLDYDSPLDVAKLSCLKIAENAILLLSPDEKSPGSFWRAGCSTTHADKDFFAGALATTVLIS